MYAAWLSSEQANRSRAIDAPQLGRSGARHQASGASRVATSLHTSELSGLPWTKTIGGAVAAPASATCASTQPTRIVRDRSKPITTPSPARHRDRRARAELQGLDAGVDGPRRPRRGVRVVAAGHARHRAIG